MKLNKHKIIERVEELLAEDKARFEAKQLKEKSEYTAELQKWRTTHQPKLLIELRRVTAHVAKGVLPETPLTDYYVRQQLWGSVPPKPKTLVYHAPSDLTKLKELLKTAVVGDDLTLADIKTLGFNATKLVR